MRGPSSSHTAGPFHIGTIARALLGGEPASARFTFDPGGSFAQVYHEQGSDLGFAAGLMGWSLTDERFPRALEIAAGHGLKIGFGSDPLPKADHPNVVDIDLESRDGHGLRLSARSIGGGSVVFTRLQDWPVHLTGDAHDVLVECDPDAEPLLSGLLAGDGKVVAQSSRQSQDGCLLLHIRRQSPLSAETRALAEASPEVHHLWATPPVFFVKRGRPLFSSAEEMIALAQERKRSLGQIAVAYEAELLGLSESDVMAEAVRRYEVMRSAVRRGLSDNCAPMQLLEPAARDVYQAEAAGRLAIGGIHARAAAMAMAVMHVNNSMGVVCAAPTAGAAGALPGALVTLAEEKGLSQEQIGLAVMAASAVGLILGIRATFAAEVAGCNVEIGAGGAMAAAAVVEVAGGTPRQVADAAAISFQNTMGSTCDLVQGMVEIPCHTRNAVAASSAFVCADLILGGYANPIPLDETIDAVYATGQMLPRELRCTALGGLSVTPSALALKRIRE